MHERTEDRRNGNMNESTKEGSQRDTPAKG